MGIAGIHAIYGGNICSVYYTTPQAILKHKLDQIHSWKSRWEVSPVLQDTIDCEYLSTLFESHIQFSKVFFCFLNFILYN